MNNKISQGRFRSACGSIVEINGRCVKHLEAHPEVATIIVEAIGKANFGNLPVAEIEVEMGRIVGRKTKVTTNLESPDSPMMFVLRNGRALPSRVAVCVSICDETTNVAIIAKQASPSNYILTTCWIGNLAQKEPWDKTICSSEEYDKCLMYWCQNALLYDPATMGTPFESTWNQILRPLNLPQK